MKNHDSKKQIENLIWYNEISRSANNFIFDLQNQERNLKEFSAQKIYHLASICDQTSVKIKDLKD